MTSRASGRPTGTTTAAIPGRKSGIGRTDARGDEPGRAARSGALADRDRCPDQAGDAARQVVPDRAADVDAASARPALRRAPHGARWLPGPALVLRRLIPARRR